MCLLSVFNKTPLCGNVCGFYSFANISIEIILCKYFNNFLHFILTILHFYISDAVVAVTNCKRLKVVDERVF